MLQQVIASTTHLDRHFERMTKEQLEKWADDINSRLEVMPILIEHDRTFPPLGKVLNAKVQELDNGEFALIFVQEFFEDFYEMTNDKGDVLIMSKSHNDTRPFIQGSHHSNKISIGTDLHNFKSKEKLRSFQKEIQNSEEQEIQFYPVVRKSFAPDPTVIIHLGSTIAKFLIACKVIDKVGDKIGDKISEQISEDAVNIYKLIRNTVKARVKNMNLLNRETIYIIDISTNLDIQFIIKTKKPSILAEKITLIKLKPYILQAEEFSQTLGIIEAQFILNDDQEWELNYMLDKEGSIIGTKKSFAKQAQYLKHLELKQTPPKRNQKKLKN